MNYFYANISSPVKFSKMVASGNDFVLLDTRREKIARSKLSLLSTQICPRKYGVGADGVLVLEKSKKADIKMRIFNPDGSEPQMCGNGVRCAALYCAGSRRRRIKIETKAGLIEAEVNRSNAGVKIKMSEPMDIRLDMCLNVARRKIRVNFINTGVPHAVIFVEGIGKIDVVNIGRQIRFHKRFLPDGTNVDFVQIIDDNNIRIRTYERGVEDETLACGTGSVAAALITNYKLPVSGYRRINVHTKSGEVLKVGFILAGGIFSDVWLEGQARQIYLGVINKRKSHTN